MQDFLLDNNGDIAWDNNDLVWGQSDSQHQDLLMTTSPGSWKENPDVGVRAFWYLLSKNLSALIGNIRRQFSKDGMTVNSIGLDANGNIQTDAQYPA